MWSSWEGRDGVTPTHTWRAPLRHAATIWFDSPCCCLDLPYFNRWGLHTVNSKLSQSRNAGINKGMFCRWDNKPKKAVQLISHSLAFQKKRSSLIDPSYRFVHLQYCLGQFIKHGNVCIRDDMKPSRRRNVYQTSLQFVTRESGFTVTSPL